MMLNIYSLLLPLLLSLVPKGLNKKKKERREIRVGKAMVDKKKQGDEAIDDKPRDKRRKGAQGLTVWPLTSS